MMKFFKIALFSVLAITLTNCSSVCMGKNCDKEACAKDDKSCKKACSGKSESKGCCKSKK